MAQPLSAHEPAVAVSPPRDMMRSVVLGGVALLGAGLLVAALALWFHYGTTVFFETIAAGFAACF